MDSQWRASIGNICHWSVIGHVFADVAVIILAESLAEDAGKLLKALHEKSLGLLGQEQSTGVLGVGGGWMGSVLRSNQEDFIKNKNKISLTHIHHAMENLGSNPWDFSVTT